MEVNQNTDSSVDESSKKQSVDGLEGEIKTQSNEVDPNTPISYGAYQKLLAEKRKLREQHVNTVSKLAEYESRDKERAEQQLIADKEFDKVLTEYKTQIDQLSNKLSQSETGLSEYRKMNSFIAGLGSSKLDPKYFSLVPLEEIQMDENGEIDHESLVKTITDFKTEHSRLLVDPRTDLPNKKVGSGKTKGLTVREWKNLKTSKEQTDRFKEVDWSTRDD
jgi:hypothetical protein